MYVFLAASTIKTQMALTPVVYLLVFCPWLRAGGWFSSLHCWQRARSFGHGRGGRFRRHVSPILLCQEIVHFREPRFNSTKEMPRKPEFPVLVSIPVEAKTAVLPVNWRFAMEETSLIASSITALEDLRKKARTTTESRLYRDSKLKQALDLALLHNESSATLWLCNCFVAGAKGGAEHVLMTWYSALKITEWWNSSMSY